jgi:two-component system, OmpR family, sensor histidine kinase BaeS
LGLLLARTITRPVRELTAATAALAQGKLSQPVAVRSKDELGVLTQSFNKMSSDLERSNTLRRQMTADIAHDLRSPLAVITGYLEGLKDGVVKPTPQRFSAMYDEAVYLQRLVEDLRTLSLADAGELSITKQVIQPGELIERLAAAFQHPAEQKQVSIQKEVAADLPPIHVDPERILQALENLITNSLRYTQENGLIVLSAHRGGDGVAMDVQDNGAGIDPEVLPHVFDRFYRGDGSRQDGGSGLGLAIAKSIVELHGGKIEAASEGIGKGSRFTILIPV